MKSFKHENLSYLRLFACPVNINFVSFRLNKALDTEIFLGN